MAKLYFRYGTMSSAKTLNLLAVAYNYGQQNKKALILKPALDTRFGSEKVRSRAGLEQPADMLIKEDTILDLEYFRGANCVLVDECHFLKAQIIEQFRRIATEINVPVICYGLRADFQSHLFEGSRRLMELADAIEEIKTTCAFCDRKSIMNLKHVGGRATLSGPSIDLGAEEKYLSACFGCYLKELKKSGIDLWKEWEETHGR